MDQFGMELSKTRCHKIHMHTFSNVDNGGRYFASYAPIGSTSYECIPVLEAYMNLRSPYQDERYNVHYE